MAKHHAWSEQENEHIKAFVARVLLISAPLSHLSERGLAFVTKPPTGDAVSDDTGTLGTSCSRVCFEGSTLISGRNAFDQS
jgi:hypothetical protein